MQQESLTAPKGMARKALSAPSALSDVYRPLMYVIPISRKISKHKFQKKLAHVIVSAENRLFSGFSVLQHRYRRSEMDVYILALLRERGTAK